MRRKRNKIIITCLIIFFTIVSLVTIKIYEEKNNINYILKKSSYSYLPLEAQNYIKEVYEETGDLILTEKNKVPKLPYLNPEYVEYLSLSLDEQKEVNVIPDETIVEYSYTTGTQLLNEDDIPSSFDLRNVNGMNYVTPIKNQGGLGLCWAFATNAQAESLLLIKNNKSYSSDAQIFSERQIDYATADDGIIDSNPLYPYSRILGDGGNFKYATSVMIDSLGLVDHSWVEYDDDDYNPKEKNEVYQFSNSLYEVTKTVLYPQLELSELDPTDNEDQLLRKNYLNNLKSLIMQYGGSYISTADPTGKCSVSIKGSRFIYDDGICASAGHAMQVIGWDDNYEYNVCTGTKNQSGYYHINTNTSNCSNGTVITGKGAWLLKNSWGNSSQYVYIAYDSQDMIFNLITELDQKDWDNYYSSTTNMNYTGSSTSAINYDKQSSSQEQLKKIKFNANTQDAVYNVYVATDNQQSYKLYSTITSGFPGIYTVDLSDKLIYLNDEKFYVKIVSKGGKLSSGISVYTDNVEEEYQIKSEDATYEQSLTNIDKYIIRITSETVSIKENETIDYKILNQNREEISVNYTYTENIVFANKVFSKIIIDKELSKGNYILQSIYKDQVLDESNLIIDKEIVTIEGDGTENNPYVITTPAQLNLIRKDAFAFYELGNDIDLTYDTTNENGLFYNEGKGWEPIKYSNIKVYSETNISINSGGFSGGLNGNNYKIIGLNINRPDESVIGLFANTYNQNFSNLYIKNLILENPNIVGDTYVGGVVGYVHGTTYERCLNISNLVVSGGTITGNNYVGGVIGYLNAGSYLKNYYVGGERHLIDSLYNSATIEANNYAGGIFGFVTNIIGYKEGNSIFKISNILNKGLIISNDTAGGIAGQIKTRENNSITIYNSMNTGQVLGADCSSGITCELSSSSVGNLILNNIYYTNDIGINSSNSYIILNNVTKKTIDELTNINSYSEWNAFSDYWKIESIDNIVRLPVLNFMDFNYTKIATNSIELSNELNLYTYITPDNAAAANIKLQVEDDNIVSLNEYGVLKAESDGSTRIHITSYYDGYKGTIEVITIIPKQINYYSNYGENRLITQEVENRNIKLKDNEFIRVGYTFKGWNTKSDGSGTSYTNGQEVSLTTDLTLYAIWEVNKYKVKYYSFFNETEEFIKEEEFTYDIESELMDAYENTPQGYNFKEWNDKTDGSGTKYLPKQKVKNLTDDSEIALYAIYEPIMYKVVFNSNNGNNETIEQLLTYDEEKNLNQNIFIKEGYKFISWNIKEDGSGLTYTDGQRVKNLTTNDSVINLYAQWEKITYTLKFDANGGIGTMKDQQYIYDTLQQITKNTYSKTGYYFKEWNTRPDGTGSSYQDEKEIKINDTLTLYAIWEESYSYKIKNYSYDDNQKYIDHIKINTLVDDYKKNIDLNVNYSINVDYKTINSQNLLYTGSKTKIYKHNNLFIEYTNIIRGEVTGDGKINYLDYVSIYNHIQKVKHPELNKNELKNEYLIAADISEDGKVNYLDYVQIYNKIKELKSNNE